MLELKKGTYEIELQATNDPCGLQALQFGINTVAVINDKAFNLYQDLDGVNQFCEYPACAILEEIEFYIASHDYIITITKIK